MKKHFNLRLPVIYSATLAFGIICAVLCACFKIDGVWLLLPAVLLFIVALAYVIKTKKSGKAFAVFSVALVYLLGAIYCYAVIYSYSDREFFINSAVTITGRVEDTGVSSAGNSYIILSNLKFGDKKVNGKLIAYLLDSAEGYCRRGYTVSFYSEPELLSFFSDGSVDYRTAQGIKYSCFVAGSFKSQYGFSLFGEINNYIQKLLFNNLNRETASVCNALLTGNADFISQGTITAFRYGGIAHIFAVSGLHIGVVYGVLNFIFKKIGLNKFASSAIIIAFITLYSGICLFSSSSVRAVVMCSVSAIASCFHKKYDSWNALSLSAIIILLINPLALFQVGFALSFGAMLGIVLLSKNISSALRFLPEKVSATLGVGWSAQFATLPVLATSFGYISIAGLFLNFIFIPLISALYVFLLALTLLSAIMPFAEGALITCASLPIEFIMSIVTLCGFENAIISGEFSRWIYVPFIVIAIGITDKIRQRLYLRGAFIFFSATALFFCSVFPEYGKGTCAYFGAGYDGAYIYLNNKHGTVLVVTEDIDEVPQAFCEEADSLVICGGENSLEALFALGNKFDSVYMRGNIPYLYPFDSCEITYSDSFTVCGIDFTYQEDVLYIDTDGAKLAVVTAEKGTAYGQIPQGLNLCLYCYGTQSPLLINDRESYNLSKCGKMKYIFSAGELFPAYAVLKE